MKTSPENNESTQQRSPKASIQMMRQSQKQFKKLSIIPHMGNSGSKLSETNINCYIIKNDTWELVPRPPNRKIIGSKWALRHKKDEVGRIVRLKARLVAKGFS